ncbi:hypothetical protein QS468_08905 [Bacillus subtilis]|uniref:hypothetical protein n=1 Tax=Pseudomonas sp. MWU12-2029 TaxID=2927805 RepID=UPI00200E55DF|nr:MULTISPECIES: hypothetical protein [unclassified Pseudomonas]MDL5592822.1 hypothetical protein [Bacillus subtilis]
MKWSFDWKYLLATALAIASLMFPVYLWQSDLKAHDISVRLLSSSSLQPFATSKIYDVKMTVNGVELVNPYFSIYELVNSGSKPILNSDFESPIIFAGNNGLTFVSARVDLTEPKDIPVKVGVEPTQVTIAPFLSNPNDKVFLSIITSGPNPAISVKARIAGVREITIVDSSVATASPIKLVIYFIFCVIALTTYFTHAFIFSKQLARLFNHGLALASMLGCGLAGAMSMRKFIDELGLITGGLERNENWFIASFLVLSIGAAYVIKRYFLRADDLYAKKNLTD